MQIQTGLGAGNKGHQRHAVHVVADAFGQVNAVFDPARALLRLQRSQHKPNKQAM